MKTQFFNGLHFTKDEKTGYYLNSTIRKRMHRYVWEFYNGEIPKGYEIHHKNHNVANNDIENLEILTSLEHRIYHSKIQGVENARNGHLDKIRPMTKEWHSSEEGKEWHREHYENNKDKLHAKKTFKCDQCGNEFKSQNIGVNRFCSNKCKSKFRRESGVDNEYRECNLCGRHFTTNKYSKTKSCSKSCAAKLRNSVSKN